jgi:hypothetical protein
MNQITQGELEVHLNVQIIEEMQGYYVGRDDGAAVDGERTERLARRFD